jgi:electron transport complex protein RnfB
MLIAIVSITLLGSIFGLGLGWAAKKFRVESDPVVERIEALLPQTQCGQCNFPGCRPYAEAIASGEADINQCPPGGEIGIKALADLLGLEALPLNPDNGEESVKTVAVIDEPACIGCTLCIQACPVDAIVGAAKLMHTVIEAECTGCELCLPPCPVDCIDLISTPDTLDRWHWPKPEIKSAVPLSFDPAVRTKQ